MKRFLPTFSGRSSSSDSVPQHREDSPEAIILKEITAFCESNTTGASQGAEVVHLPKIVEVAESSPAAAKEAALRIRKYLSDPAGTPNSTQYNAIMLMRILADNPGPTFTRNFDAKFVTTTKELLRSGRDVHVQHYLRQYLDTLEQQRSEDENLKLLLAMWAKEKVKASRGWIERPLINIGGTPPPPPPPRPYQRGLPSTEELAARIEEARNSAKLLTQFVQSTPANEVEGNDLVKEFFDRCQTGQRLIQSFIQASNPPPDEDTLLTLIETNEEISVAMSGQQRAVLKARKLKASSPGGASDDAITPVASPDRGSPTAAASGASVPAPAVPVHSRPEPVAELPNTVMTGGRVPPSASRYEYNAEEFQVRNPFADDGAESDRRQGSTNDHLPSAAEQQR